jgi:hypothetical protein
MDNAAVYAKRGQFGKWIQQVKLEKFIDKDNEQKPVCCAVSEQANLRVCSIHVRNKKHENASLIPDFQEEFNGLTMTAGDFNFDFFKDGSLVKDWKNFVKLPECEGSLSLFNSSTMSCEYENVYKAIDHIQLMGNDDYVVTNKTVVARRAEELAFMKGFSKAMISGNWPAMPTTELPSKYGDWAKLFDDNPQLIGDHSAATYVVEPKLTTFSFDVQTTDSKKKSKEQKDLIGKLNKLNFDLKLVCNQDENIAYGINNESAIRCSGTVHWTVVGGKLDKLKCTWSEGQNKKEFKNGEQVNLKGTFDTKGGKRYHHATLLCSSASSLGLLLSVVLILATLI